MDTPLFGGDTRRRREINLGGSMTASTSTSILQDAKARRAQREQLKRMEDGAARIQACWRCAVQRRQVKKALRERFEKDVTGTTGLRCLVLVGADEAVLGTWSAAMVSGGNDRLSNSLSDPSWATLLPRAMFLLLQSVAKDPQSQYASNHVAVLNIVLSRSLSAVPYLLRHGYYEYLSRAITSIPMEAKSSSTVLPSLVMLLVAPYSLLDNTDDLYKQAFDDLLALILTIPLLPNRLPIASLTFLAPRIPLNSFHLVDSSRVISIASTIEQKIHLLANLCAFVPPRYPSLSADSLAAYLNFTLALMCAIPIHGLEPPQRGTQEPVHPTWSDDSDSDVETQVAVVDNFAPKVRLPDLDSKTRIRLQTFPSPTHLNCLLEAVHRHRSVQPALFAWFEERQIAQPEGTRPLSKRQIATLSPRLGVLNNIPFAIPFETRVSIFRSFIQNDASNRGFNRYSHYGISRITVRRGSIAQDGFDRLLNVDLKGPIAITFIDQFGQEEAGIDGGGVFKEFLTALCKEVFDTDRGLWLATKNNELYPNPHSYAVEAHSLNWYRFIGRILGKALYEGILVDVGFAEFFLAKWLGKQSFLDDLASLDPELYQGLIFLKHYTGNPEELSLNFTVAEEEFGVAKSKPLVPNGENIAVTRENRLQYIYLVSHYRLNKQIRQQSDAFFDGLSEMIDPKWLRMFNQQELQILLGGVNAPIDLDDLRLNTKYGGLYDDNEPTIQRFWRVVASFDQEQRRNLLRFATSCSRPPLLGFKELVPNFAIRDAGSDTQRLPTASTCVNLLKLPRYTSEKTLREKLLQAINSNAGFDLS
ncbi:hypothetical protein EUX98_g4538 [Antrodiella citrinella]|uniref:HECT-type E3 ubiquitin transferase n=1 Tax=Antrodiella citrinella TaxID=2447956 RepID=A0A4S4MW90_9APHY|nr:hypothetical protein EUX98_g4538 [Antrodiella citrinella]